MSDRSQGTTPPLVAALELTASEQPELLPWLIEVVWNSSARSTIRRLAEAWGVRPVDLGRAAVKAARDLDRLEARRGVWRHVGQVIQDPHLAALHGIAVERCGRVCVRTRRRRLETIARRVADDLEAERQREWIQHFIGVAAPGAETVHVDEGRPHSRP